MRNCYNVPARLFVLGGKKLLSHEGTTQRDPAAIAICEIALSQLLKHLATCYLQRDPKMVAFADDLTSAGRLLKLRSCWKVLLNISPKYGYFAKPSKTTLVVKSEYESKAAKIFDNTNIRMTSNRQRNLGAVIGSELYRKEIHQRNS